MNLIILISQFVKILLLLSQIKKVYSNVVEEARNQLCNSMALNNNVPSLFDIANNNCNDEISDSNALKLVFLSNNVTCNDGTPAGYYIRKSETNSKKWIVYLEGGWYCYNEENCRERWSRVRYLMSSEHWLPFRSGSGILSNDPEENPYWWNANHVFVPYCTSDIWSGRRAIPSRRSSFTFMGAAIVKQVIRELISSDMKQAKSLILAGSSAGGVGVMLNLEPVQKVLTKSGCKAKLKGITDSGWFIDQPPFILNSNIVTPVQAVKQAFPYWRSQVPHTCRLHYPRESWKCFIGYRIYPTLSAPLFVFQWLFDEVQIKVENIGTPVTKQQWEYIHTMGEILRNSFQNVTSVFAPSCISHSILSRNDWHYIRIDDIPLPDALRCWERELIDNSIEKRINKVEYSRTTLPTKNRQRRRSKSHKACNKSKKKNCWKNRLLRSTDSCSYRLIERCSWPQCNHYCPKLQNPLTGEELDLLELLKSFGLDMKNVAAALGVDIHTLNSMGQRELITLLTQQVS